MCRKTATHPVAEPRDLTVAYARRRWPVPAVAAFREPLSTGVAAPGYSVDNSVRVIGSHRPCDRSHNNWKKCREEHSSDGSQFSLAANERMKNSRHGTSTRPAPARRQTRPSPMQTSLTGAKTSSHSSRRGTLSTPQQPSIANLDHTTSVLWV